MFGRNAVCVTCGAYKRDPMTRCKGCGFEPSSDYELGRALILSRQFNFHGKMLGRSPDDLKRIAADIRRGRPYLFDNNEQEVAVRAYQDLRETARKRSLKLKAIAVLIGIALIGWLVRMIIR